ncbi:MAG: hypothetical protein ABJC13_19855 [Acidobacteriota bacterium]
MRMKIKQLFSALVSLDPSVLNPEKGDRFMRMISSALLITGLLLAAAARGQDSPRPPWKWTDEERISKRYDPSSMRSRENAYVAETEGALDAAGRDVVQGDKNPELFLPIELYQDLLMRAFSPLPEASQGFRDEYQSKSGGIRIDNDFWQRLEQVARPYLDSIKAQRALAKEYQTAHPGRRAEIDRQAEEFGKKDCRLHAQSLETARATFGREAFDRFLYEAIAPGTLSVSVYGTSVDSNVSADHLRYLAGGC